MRLNALDMLLKSFERIWCLFVAWHWHLQVTSEALQNFYRSRMPRVAGISLLSGLASDLIINAPWCGRHGKH